METVLLAREYSASPADLERLLEATGCIEFGTQNYPQTSPPHEIQTVRTALGPYAIGRQSAVAVVRSSTRVPAKAVRTFRETAFFLHFPSATAIPIQELYAELPDDEPPYASFLVSDLRELRDDVRFTLAIRREDDVDLDRVSYIARPNHAGSYSLAIANAPRSP